MQCWRTQKHIGFCWQFDIPGFSKVNEYMYLGSIISPDKMDAILARAAQRGGQSRGRGGPRGRSGSGGGYRGNKPRSGSGSERSRSGGGYRGNRDKTRSSGSSNRHRG